MTARRRRGRPPGDAPAQRSPCPPDAISMMLAHDGVPDLDPLKWVEERTLRYIKAQELLVADPAADPRLRLLGLQFLTRIGPLGRLRVDVTGSRFVDPALVDAIGKLPQAQLERLAAGEDVPLLAAPESNEA